MDVLEIAAAFGVFVATVIYGIVKRVRSGRRSEEKINRILWPLMEKYKCNRVFLMEYTNGSGYTGDHKQKMKMVYELVSGERPLKEYFDSVIVSEEAHAIMLHFNRNKHYFFETFSHVHSEEVKDRYRSRNIKAMYMFPVYFNNKIKYTLSLTWPEIKSLSSNEVQNIYLEVDLLARELK